MVSSIAINISDSIYQVFLFQYKSFVFTQFNSFKHSKYIGLVEFYGI